MKAMKNYNKMRFDRVYKGKEAADLFKDAENRRTLIGVYKFMSCRTHMSQPNLDFVKPNDQYFVSAICKQAVIDTVGHPTRKSEDCLPTAFVFEADGVPLKQQWENIKEGKESNVLLVTFSGHKSLHYVVPIDMTFSWRLAKSARVFKEVWKCVARELFKDPSILDEACATRARLTRMPGAYRRSLDASGKIIESHSDPEQVCCMFNPLYKFVDIKHYVQNAEKIESQEEFDNKIRSLFARPADSDYDSQLRHLKNSAMRYPSPCKKIAVSALVDNEMPAAQNYIGTLRYLSQKFPMLARPFYDLVHAAHPSNLPSKFESYVSNNSIL